ncbi:hypothetical protein ON010_g7852 [Phytophthora cinnamomi]|nr:hypothetical protein ON010_g7852 [Phytophthora cinnamomi]
MFGDYEAQRHWMELTINLPVSDWYFNTTSNDLLYWGLDYPPLTAYVSYLFGRAAEITEPAMVELTSSRGYETATSKVFMRTSVLLCFTALGVALILQGHEFLGSISYCLALNFKQMALYYAPAFGVFLLARCIYRKMCILHLVKLAVAVIATFTVMWFPFCMYTSAEETCLSTMAQVVHRIFPFGRGLFEDKVANFWCIADFVLKIRRHVTPTLQMRLCARENDPVAAASDIVFVCAQRTSVGMVQRAVHVQDGLVLPYIVLQLAYVSVGVAPFLTSRTAMQLHVQQTKTAPGYQRDGSAHPLFRAYVMVPYCFTV